MILVATGWRYCPVCRLFKTRDDFYKRQRPDGRRVPAGYCKPCKRQATRESQHRHRDSLNVRARARYQRSKTDPELVERRRRQDRERRRAQRARDPESYAARQAENDRRYREYVNANPERRTERLVARRIDTRIRVERETGRLAGAFTVSTAIEPYRGPSNRGVLPAGPLVQFLRSFFDGWAATEIHDALRGAVSDRGLYRILVEHQPVVALEFADRVLTRGLGRPDLLNALYPVEES